MSDCGEEGSPTNPLKKYLPVRAGPTDCRNCWKPRIYEFKKGHLDYNGNAFDVFIPEMRFHHQEAMAELEDLQKIPTDIDRFYTWIAEARRRSISNELGLDNKKEHFVSFTPKHEYISSANTCRKPIRRAYSFNQLDERVANLRSNFFVFNRIKPSPSRNGGYFCNNVHCLGACDVDIEPVEIQEPPPRKPSPPRKEVSWEFEWDSPV